MYDKILAGVEAVFDNASTPEEIATAVAAALSDEEEDLDFFYALVAAGVDNWKGYSLAWDILEERKNA